MQQPVNLKALQDMLLQSVGLLRNPSNQDLLSKHDRSKQLEKGIPTLSLDLDLSIGTLYVPEDVTNTAATVIAVNLGSVNVRIRGNEMQDLAASDGTTFKYMPIDVNVKGLGVSVSPHVCDKPLVSSTSVKVNLLIQDTAALLLSENVPPPSMPKVKINVAVAPMVLR